MWKKPWGLSEGIGICGGLVAIGIALQLTNGNISWGSFAYPINVSLLAIYLLILLVLYTLRQRIYFVRWAMTYQAALPALAFTVGMTFLMGMIRQLPESAPTTDILGFSKMISCWSFVLVYGWMTTILGWVTIKHLHHFQVRRIPFLLNHLGLFIALLCATLGSADMKRLTMQTQVGQTEWRAIDEQRNIQELPLAIELQSFTIDQYPPKLMIIDNTTGQALPQDKPEHLLVEEGMKEGTLCGWKVQVLDYLDMAASVTENDTIQFVEWHSLGAASATQVLVTSPDGQQTHQGWVSCGSFAFPYQALRLNESYSLVMPEREPQRFASKVKIYTQSGQQVETEIEVNRPAEIDGWKIYQLSYDETKGRWSDISIFELVTDPWLPWVYLGIILMMIGAVCMFVTAHKEKKEEEA